MTRVEANSEFVRWEGRTRSGLDHVHLGFPGASATLSVNATSVIVELEATTEDCHVRVGFGDNFSGKLQLSPGRQRIELLDGSFEGELTLFRCTECWQGTFDVVGFEIVGDVSPPKQKAGPRLLFIGDSITCGAATLLTSRDELNQSRTNDAYYAYGTQIGRRLEAEVHLVSYGGRGLYRDWQGFTSSEINNAPDFFERSTPDDPDAVWDHARFTPDLVSICLGTNDFNLGVVEEDVFVPLFERFVNRIWTLQPNAKILLLNSPMQDAGEKRGALLGYLKTISSLTGCHFQEISFQPGTEVDSHPNAAQHMQMADEIEPVIRQLLGQH